MKIAVVGATGVLGRHVVPRLLERGHEVRAVVRSHYQSTQLDSIGVQAFVGDILVRESLMSALRGSDCVLHLATAIPRGAGGGDWTMNDRIRREGTQHLVQCAIESGARRYVQQSIIMLYGDRGQHTVDESVPLQPPSYAQSAFDMERQVHDSSLDWCILRGGYFYGHATGTEKAWREQAATGRLRAPLNGEAFISLIHVIDMARAVVAAAEVASPRSTYNVVDDCPVSYSGLFTFIARQVGAPEPQPDHTRVLSLRCSNHRIKTELGWHPLFPSFRSGLVLEQP